jgi:hypothetical protein
LKEVVVEAPDGTVYIFRCNKWLDVKEDDGKIERVLQPTLVEHVKKEPSREHIREPRREDSRHMPSSKKSNFVIILVKLLLCCY